KKVVVLGLALLFVAAGSSYAADTHEALFKEVLASGKELLAVVKTVKDADTAKAAAPKVKKAMETMDDLKKRGDKLGPPTKDDIDAMEKLIPDIQTFQKDMNAEITRLKTVKGTEEIVALLEPEKKGPATGKVAPKAVTEKAK